MAVTIHCNGTSNSLVHKGNSGFTKCTLPDVCKTPSPGGPVPVPYPVIVSTSTDLVKGSTTVKIDGGNMVAIKGSEFSRCTGDEPGTAGGVKSSTNMKEATWLLYSFDVKIEGKNACRLSDKMLMNHGNTACLAGHNCIPVSASGADYELAAACKDLHEQYDETKKKYAEKHDQSLHEKLHPPGGGAPTATPVERAAYLDMLIQRLELMELLVGQKQAYVDMDCDRFAWEDDQGNPTPKTEADRRAAHIDDINQKTNAINNAWNAISRFRV